MNIRHGVIGLLTAVLLTVPQSAVPFAVSAENDKKDAKETQEWLYKEIPADKFRVSDLAPKVNSALDYTDWWFSEWDDCRYLFLPAAADREHLTITYSAGDTLYLNDTPVVSGEMTSLLSEADSFQITVGGTDCGTLKIMQSNLGSIYLSTKSGGLDALDNDRNLVETGTVLMLNADGGTEYSGAFEKLKSHGNSSWDYSKKKPYNLKLPNKANLYGMGKAKKWTLLSNYLDHSMLRNKLTEEMCKAAGMEYVMDSVFVDLYADGSYRGTYQLSERVQIQKNRVNIRDLEEITEDLNSRDPEEYPQNGEGAKKLGDYKENSYKYYEIPNDPSDITGGYLLELQQWNRYSYKTKSGFVTSRGQAVSVSSPEYASKAQVEYIRDFVQDMEDAMYSDTGYNAKGKHYSDYLDMDSLVIAYLVQEISQNIDATYSSFYFWKDSDLTGDGKIHFGPAWDFDLGYCNFITSSENSDGEIGFSSQPDNLYVAFFPIHGYVNSGQNTTTYGYHIANGRSWLGQLYHEDKAFVKRAAKLYMERFEPFLTELTEGDSPYLRQLAERIRPSAEMSNARWHTYGGAEYCVFGSSSGATYMESAEIVRDYIERRKNWLTGLWQPYTFVRGDVNADGVPDTADLVLLQKWLLGVPGAQLAHWQAADLYEDGCLDVFDLCLLKRELLFVSD